MPCLVIHLPPPLSWHECHLKQLQLAESSSQLLRNMALEAMDKSICAVLGSHEFQEHAISAPHGALYDVSIITQNREDVYL